MKKIYLPAILVFALTGLLACGGPARVETSASHWNTANVTPIPTPPPAATPDATTQPAPVDLKTLHLPASGDYPVAKSDIFKGTPAAPILTTKRARMYKTVITSGAKEGPDFAGHYTVVTWGAGLGNFSMAVVDAKTGKMYLPPFESVSLARYGFPMEGAEGNPAYKLESRLFAFIGCPGKEYTGCPDHAKNGLYIYDFNNGRFKLVRFVKNADLENGASK